MNGRIISKSEVKEAIENSGMTPLSSNAISRKNAQYFALHNRVIDNFIRKVKSRMDNVRYERELSDCDYSAVEFYFRSRQLAIENDLTCPYAIGIISGYRLINHSGGHVACFAISKEKSVYVIEPYKEAGDLYMKSVGDEFYNDIFI